MKRLNLVFFVLIVFPLSGVSQTVINYSYDAAGNRTTRTSSIEVAAVAEQHAIIESKILELNFEYGLPDCRSEISHVLKSASGDRADKELIKNYPSENKRQIYLCSVEHPAIISQAINTKQKRI